MAVINKNFRTGRRAVYNLNAHVVLTPKYRKKVFNETVHSSCEESFKHIYAKFNIKIIVFNTVLYHAYLIMSYLPSVSLSVLIGQLKGYSSRVLRRDHYEVIKGML